MTRFPLEDGHYYTEVVFWRDKQGKVHAFPQENANLVRLKGTEEAKAALSKILEEKPR